MADDIIVVTKGNIIKHEVEGIEKNEKLEEGGYRLYPKMLILRTGSSMRWPQN